MKLLRKTGRDFLLLSMVTVLVAMIGFGFTIRHIVKLEIDEDLYEARLVLKNRMEDGERLAGKLQAMDEIIEIRQT